MLTTIVSRLCHKFLKGSEFIFSDVLEVCYPFFSLVGNIFCYIVNSGLFQIGEGSHKMRVDHVIFKKTLPSCQ